MVSGISGSAKATIADAKLVTSQISCKELLESYRMRRRAETELLIKADGERNIGILTFYIKDEPVEMVEDAASPSDVLSDGSVRELVATSLSIKSDNEDKDNVITIYNPSALMPGNLLLGRMESLDSEDDTEARFFHQNKASGVWELVAGAPVFKHLQDPFYAGVIQGWHILGGVRIHKVVVDDRVQVDYRTVFYRFKKSINELVDSEGVVVGPFVIGPEGMKDIRLCQLKSGKIALFTRPQGIVGGLGKIAYAEIDSLEDLTEGINKAEIVQELFIDEKEWGGANQVFALSSGLIGVLGHIASKDRLPSGKEIKHYYAITFLFDPGSRRVYNLQILAEASDFGVVKVKNEEVRDVLFSSALERFGDGRAYLYTGIGDRQVGYIEVRDPFWQFDQ